MTAIIIIAAILAVLLLIALLRIGVLLEFSEEGLHVKALAGPVKIQLVSSKTEKQTEKKDNADKKAKRKKKSEDKPEKKKGMDLNKIKPVIKTAFDALGRFFSHLRIDTLIVRYTIAKDDPADTAMLYGTINAGAGIIKPYLARFKSVKHSDIRTYTDFAEKKDKVYVLIRTTIAIWELLYIVFKIDFKSIRSLLK